MSAAGVLARADALLACDKPREAISLLASAHAGRPGDAALLARLGRALSLLNRNEEAVGALLSALAAGPGAPAIHRALVVPLIALGQLDAALAHAAEAYRRLPDADSAVALSCALGHLCRYEEALLLADIALEQAPGLTAALLNRAILLKNLGRFDDAIATGARAIELAPDNMHARLHQGELLLGAGCMTAEAWELHEARLTVKGFRPNPNVTRWRGGDVAGKTVLLEAEQGLGDTLHFVRYVPLLAARGARVVLKAQPPLLRLLAGTPGLHALLPVGDPPPPFDAVSPLLSLPGCFGTDAGTIPPPVPYAHRFAPPPEAGPLRVGLAWAGNPGFVDDRRRSVPPAALSALAGLPGVAFCNLQFGAGPDAVPGLPMEDLMAGVADFLDTAHRIASLHLVIACDTAVAHLAATMGKPTWLLARFRGCWRWGHEGETTPWYPALRLYRQPRPGDWASVLQQVRAGLAAARAWA